MYYENKRESFFKYIIFFMFIIIIFLLWIVVLNVSSNRELYGKYYTEKITNDNANETIENENKKENENNENIENLIYEASKSIVGISKIKQNDSSIFVEDAEVKLGLASGVIISENGYILTNAHVVGNKYSICYVTVEDGKRYNANVVWIDENIDLAIIKISAYDIQKIILGDSDKINLADDVYAIGNPIGFEFQRTVTKGIISGINRTIKVEEEKEVSYMEDLIQTDACINEGNSGGALINEKGELIGINTIKLSDADGIGFAVPINLVKPILEKLENEAHFEEAYLGISGFDKEVIPYLDSEIDISSGIYVAKVNIDGPVYLSRIKEGDIILEIDGLNINKMNELKKYIYSKKPGDSVKLKVKRDFVEFDVEVILGKK